MKPVMSLTMVFLLAGWASAYGQGGGASVTGTIQGRISDAHGAVLPGVTVTASSPSLLGTQTTVSSETGNYRFPAVPPGTYLLTYELSGFTTLKREGIIIALGFTANLNAELALATVEETVVVTGDSPIIDSSATRVVQHFKLADLQSIPNSRDMWALLAITPGVQMRGIDVGGNKAGNQLGYSAYGSSGQVRVLIEGINITDGTSGAGFYFDYSSLEEVFLGTLGQSAEMPNTWCSEPVPYKVGRQPVQRRVLHRLVQQQPAGLEHPGRGDRSRYSRPTATKSTATTIRRSTRVGRSRRTRCGGSARTGSSSTRVAQPQFLFDQTFDTTLWNAVVKGTYQINQKNKLIGYYQWGTKLQPNRLPFFTYSYRQRGEHAQARVEQLDLQGRVERDHQRQTLRRGPLRRLRLLLPPDRE